MPELDLPKRCEKAIREVEDGKKKASERVQIEIKEEHILHRLITSDDIEDGVISSAIFSDSDLSLYAEGGSLPELDLVALIKTRPSFIGSVSVKASILVKADNLFKTYRSEGFDDAIQNNSFDRSKLHLIHDPFPDPNGTEHTNHVRLICKKNANNAQILVNEAAINIPSTER
ncbi:MAG: hypothetical protein IPP97_02770 [Candidatus Obscuribacter sp.]|nr:hypothetical protein [Candidatus Obscuribacter sp.]